MNILERKEISDANRKKDKEKRLKEYYKQAKSEIFSANLKRQLSLHDKYQQDLVNDLGFAKSTVSSWCNGTKVPRMDTMYRLAAYFNIPVFELFGDAECVINESNHVEHIFPDDIKPLAIQVALIVKRDNDTDCEMLRAYNMLDDDDRSMVRDFAVRLATRKE